jgi:hypothetical protein
MRLWPFQAFSFETSLCREEALRRLHAEMGSEHWPAMLNPLRTHVGVDCERRAFIGRPLIDGAEFRVNPNNEPGELMQSRPFQPVIRARITPSLRGASVHVSLRPRIFLTLLLAVWMTPFIWATTQIAPAIARGDAPLDGWVMIAPACVLIPWLVVGFISFEDAETAETLLRATLERD